jgi:hypothetical protein
MGAIARSRDLIAAAVGVLRADASLLLYPLASGIVMLVLFALVVGGGAAMPPDQLLAIDERSYAAAIALALVFYTLVAFVVTFFTTGLVAAALHRLDGQPIRFTEGLAVARRRAGAILGYSILAATLGVLLSMIRSRKGGGIVADFLAGAGGMAWGVTTFLVVPVLAATGLGPMDAVKESARLLKKTWGEQIAGNIGLGAVFGVLIFLVVVGAGGGVAGAANAGFSELIVPLIAVGALLVVSLLVVEATLMGIYRSAVYVYARTGRVPPPFEESLMRESFGVRD